MLSKSFHLLVLLVLITAGLHAVVAQRKSTKPAVSKVKAARTIVAAAGHELLSARERETFDEINLARSNPAAYVKFLEQFKQYYHGKEIHFPDDSLLVTNEGVGVLDEAISFLQSLKPLPPLEVRKGMVLGAKVHLNDLVQTGRSGHKGSDGSITEDRLGRYGNWSESVGEDIVYHSRKAREDVISLIIDDGVATRGHRRNIFAPGFHVIGIASSSPLESGTICVITFAGGFADNAPQDLKAATPTAKKS